jgi:RHS repeat-associated protein
MAYSLADFTGQRPDPVSGHSHLGNGYRAYNPVLGYFTAPDSWSPFGIGGINPYAYCAGDPVNRADPSGHISGAGIAGMVMGAFGILMAPFTAGQSLTVMSCLIAGLEIVSGATAIATGVLEDSSPTASSVLGWVSLATGMLSLGIGVARGGGKLADGAAGLARRLQRINGKIGIPMSGEFRNARFLGINRVNDHVSWNLSFEDTVPFGRRLTIMMGSRWENNRLLPVNEVWNINTETWEECVYRSGGQLRDAVLAQGEHFNVYRLAISESAVISNRPWCAGRASGNLADRFRRSLPEGTPVVAFMDAPQATGPGADALAHAREIEPWSPAWAQWSVMDISDRFEAVEGAITFGDRAAMYPQNLRTDANNENWQ